MEHFSEITACKSNLEKIEEDFIDDGDLHTEQHGLVVNNESIPSVKRICGASLSANCGNVISGAGLQRLSALVRLDRTLVPKIPQIGAIKDFQPVKGDFLQQKHLEKSLECRQEALAWPRWTQAKTLLDGVWDEHQNQVSIRNWHSTLQFFGEPRPDRKGFLLQPEEALFLLEAGLLQIMTPCHHQEELVSRNEQEKHHRAETVQPSVPWSLEDAYVAFMNHPTFPLSLNCYKVYAKLVRAGYVVVPHHKTDYTVYERRIGLDRIVRPTIDHPSTEEENDKDEGGLVEAEEDMELEEIDARDQDYSCVRTDDDDENRDDDDNDESQRATRPTPDMNFWMRDSDSWTFSSATTVNESGTKPIDNTDLAYSSMEERSNNDDMATWMESDLQFPNMYVDNVVQTCKNEDPVIEGGMAIQRKIPTSEEAPSSVVSLKPFEPKYLPFLPPDGLLKKTSWRWDSTTSSEVWIKDVKLSKLKIKAKFRRKRKWQPWTPAGEVDASGRTSSDVWGGDDSGGRFSVEDDWMHRVMETSRNWGEFKALLSSPPPPPPPPEQRFPHLWNDTTQNEDDHDDDRTSDQVGSDDLHSTSASIFSSNDQLPRVSPPSTTSFVTPLVHPSSVFTADDIFQCLDVVKIFVDDDADLDSDDASSAAEEGVAMEKSDFEVKEEVSGGFSDDGIIRGGGGTVQLGEKSVIDDGETKVSGNGHRGDARSMKDSLAKDNNFRVLYHLYTANKSYSKSTRGAPAYRVFMRKCSNSEGASSLSTDATANIDPNASTASACSTANITSNTNANPFSLNSHPPSAEELVDLFASFRDGAPLLWASADDDDDVSFFSFYDVTLPPAPVHLE